MPLSFDPGEACQFDWSHEYARLSGVTTKVKAAHMRLCDSRMQLVWTLLTKVETSCDRILIAGGANVEAEWEQGPAV